MSAFSGSGGYASPPLRLVAGVAMLLAGLAAGVWVWRDYQQNRNFAARARQVEGQIVRDDISYSYRYRNQVTGYFPVAAYTVDGVKYTAEIGEYPSSEIHPPGSQVHLLYDPQRPRHVCMDSAGVIYSNVGPPAFAAVLLLVVGALVLATNADGAPAGGPARSPPEEPTWSGGDD